MSLGEFLLTILTNGLAIPATALWGVQRFQVQPLHHTHQTSAQLERCIITVW